MSMHIDTHTKVLGRFHSAANGTGLNIYNPYFGDTGLNAVYLLFQNQDPAHLIKGMRELGLAGAITAGFEHHPDVPALADEVTEAVRLSGSVGILMQAAGRITAHYQGGEGLASAIAEKYDVSGKEIVLVGAGSVAKTFLLALEQQNVSPSKITIINRSTAHAQSIAKRFANVSSVLPLESLQEVTGDILINATPIGSNPTDDTFVPDVVQNFAAVADVTFNNPATGLVRHADDAGLVSINGWDMFTHQAAIVLQHCLGHQADIATLRRHVAAGLGS